jgi:hypothetical protein
LLSWTNSTDQKLISSSSNAIASSKENEKTMKRAKQQEQHDVQVKNIKIVTVRHQLVLT